MTLGRLAPDAFRYIAAAEGTKVPRPFSLRPALPFFCGTNARAWWIQHLASYALIAVCVPLWRLGEGDSWQYAIAAAVVFLALPGLSGPAIRPVGVDHASTALGLAGVAASTLGGVHGWTACVLLAMFAASVKESAPVWVALWAWSPLPLLALVVPAVRWWMTRGPQPPDPIPQLQHVTDHPLRASLAAHRRRGRDAWLWVAPWGIGLAALYDPSPQALVTIAVAHASLILATDTVRLVQFAAGPVVAAAAVSVIPVEWLPAALVAHVFYFRKPEVV